MRAAPLTTIKGGINRLRTRGGARADVLYDLVNGYVTEAGTVKVRPGTEQVAELDSRTRGLCAFGGELHTFCHVQVDVPEGYVLNILVHPDPPDTGDYGYAYDYATSTVALQTIHFAEPFLGGLYIVAEFEDGSVYHYWLQPGKAWEATKQYNAGDLVQPSTPTGLLYRASRLHDPRTPWQPDEPRYDGTSYEEASEIEPTVYNGFYYLCIEVQGLNPRSGSTEPTWPTFKGGTVMERTDTGLPETATIDSETPPPASASPATDAAAEAAAEEATNPTADDPLERYDVSSDTIYRNSVRSGGNYNVP